MVKSVLLSILRKLIHKLFFWSDKKIKGFDIEEVILIKDSMIAPSQKEAILILPGLGDTRAGRKAQLTYFSQFEFDVFIPDYHDLNSYNGSLQKLEMFYNSKNLLAYKKVHVFPYILGTWILNDFILKKGRLNICSIVYDRSPIQEKSPLIFVKKMPRISKFMIGELIIDFSQIPYPSIEKNELNIGVLVESKAAKMMCKLKKEVLEYGEINWKNPVTDQEYDDLMYIPLDHYELYNQFDVVGEDIIAFFRNGKFTDSAKRTWFEWDPFERNKKN